MKIKREVKIGVLVLLALFLLFWGANFLKGHNIFSKDRYYYAVYDHVDRLSASSPVLLNGYKIGQVESVELIPSSRNLLVTFSVDEKELKIPVDSEAQIISSDLLGSKAINLLIGESHELSKNKDTLQSKIQATLSEAVNQEIAPLKKKAEDLLQTVDSAIVVVSAIFNKDARQDLGASFASIRSSLETFERTLNRIDGLVAEEREHLKGIFANVESITKNLADNNEQLSNTLSNMEAITDSLAGANLKQTVSNAAESMEELSVIMNKVSQGQGSLGQLINNDTLYINLEAAARDLDKLLVDMRENPNRYVHFSIFGRKNKSKDKDDKE
jgi:phospholipid/cholesterol/gamma-HCH transport system substrate-binding protein